MRTTILVLGFLLGGLLWGNAQEALSSYKYVVVPTKFNSFKKENQYQTSTMVKYHLVNRGFPAVYSNALPTELFANRCLGLTVVLINESNMLTTKAHISFQDCNSAEVYRTATASTKIKEFKAAYKDVIEKAFQSLDGYTYSYTPAEKESPITVNFDDDVKTLEPDPAPSQKIEEKAQKVPEKKQDAVETTAAVVQKKKTVPQEVSPVKSNTVESSLWYAQETPNGFQLVDSSPKVRLRIYQTQKEGVYLARGEANEGVVYQDQGSWYFDHYKDGKLVHQLLNIKF